MNEDSISNMKIIPLIFGVIIVLFVVFGSSRFVENLDSKDIMVIQSPVSGDLTVYTEPGLKLQLFGSVTKYPRRATYTFGADGEYPAKKLRFNDGGHADLSGGISWEMPLAEKEIITIHRTFGSAAGVESAAVAKMIDSAVYLSGPLMSSTESSGERRAELVQYIDDQAERGVYVTRVVQQKTFDPLTNAEHNTMRTEIVKDEAGNYKRQQGSMLTDFNIHLMPMSITSLDYDEVVEKQIKTRQDAITQVQIAQANARRAEQDAITAGKQGEANAAKAKWEQEVIKAQKVTEGEQKLKVAELTALEAEQYKRAKILEGEGDAAKAKLVMQANGALEQKLDAYIKVNKVYAEAIQNYKGNWVPTTVMGSSSGNSNANGAQAMIDLLTVKTARDLDLDMEMKQK
jgi:hypothetical protein